MCCIACVDHIICQSEYPWHLQWHRVQFKPVASFIFDHINRERFAYCLFFVCVLNNSYSSVNIISGCQQILTACWFLFPARCTSTRLLHLSSLCVHHTRYIASPTNWFRIWCLPTGTEFHVTSLSSYCWAFYSMALVFWCRFLDAITVCVFSACWPVGVETSQSVLLGDILSSVWRLTWVCFSKVPVISCATVLSYAVVLLYMIIL